jgi:hypothetical protein
MALAPASALAALYASSALGGNAPGQSAQVVTDPHPLAEQGPRPLPGREDPVVADLAAALGPSSREGLSLVQPRSRLGPGPFAWNEISGEQKAGGQPQTGAEWAHAAHFLWTVGYMGVARC